MGINNKDDFRAYYSKKIQIRKLELRIFNHKRDVFHDYSVPVELDVVISPSNSIDVELLGVISKFDSVFGIIFSRDSFSKDFSESRLGPSNIIVLRKIPKNTEPKIDTVTIEIIFADVISPI